MMQTAPTFPGRVAIAIHDKRLQAALDHASGGFVQKRAALVAALPEFEALRERARNVKEHVLAHLDSYLERYEEQVQRQGKPVRVIHTAELLAGLGAQPSIGEAEKS